MNGHIIFEEEQGAVGTPMWYVILGIAGTTIIGLSIQLFNSDSFQEGLIALIIVTLIMSALITLFVTARLFIRIDESTIYYRFPPFVSKEKQLGKNDIQDLHVRKYRPIWEYGGYGYRYRFRSGRGLMVAGNMGLQMTLSNGKKLLLGTQKPESMQTAVKRLQENWTMNG